MAEQELSHADFHHERAIHAIERLEEYYHSTNDMREKWEICHNDFVRKYEWIKDLIGKLE